MLLLRFVVFDVVIVVEIEVVLLLKLFFEICSFCCCRF